MSTTLRRLHQVSLRAHDVERAVPCYGDVLGLPCRLAAPNRKVWLADLPQLTLPAACAHVDHRQRERARSIFPGSRIAKRLISSALKLRSRRAAAPLYKSAMSSACCSMLPDGIATKRRRPSALKPNGPSDPTVTSIVRRRSSIDQMRIT